MKWIYTLVLGLLGQTSWSQDTLSISSELYLVRLSPHTYVHVSYFSDPKWGRFPCNGLLCVAGDSAWLFDTPMSDSVTTQLVNWVEDSLHTRLVGFVPNHWHNDCTEGMDVLKAHGVALYAHEPTNTALKLKHELLADHTFQYALGIKLGTHTIECNYLGGGHTPDNIVVWIPSEQILFGGCMVRALEARSLGNTADADLEVWPRTIQKLLDQYPQAKVVIPGHGAIGDRALLTHTLNLLNE